MTAATGTIVLAAGGTGGHIFPAQALARELTARGRRVDVITDRRGARFDVKAARIAWHRVSAGTPTGAGLIGKAMAAARIAVGVVQAFALLRRLAPAAVIGFGGYPSLPTMLAAWLLRRPRAIHEQNAVLGRVNRLLAARVTAIATSFEQTRLLPEAGTAIIRQTGNPVREEVVRLAGQGYHAPDTAGPINLLVFGGSQGAQSLSRVVPAALTLLPQAQRARLQVTQQCREEDLPAVRSAYAEAGIAAELATFFADMPAHLSDSQIIIARAGAGTVGELSVAGRPAILVPYAHAADDHQSANARALVDREAAWLIPEGEFKADSLAALLTDLLAEPRRLAAVAAKAAAAARPDATQRLADLVEALATGGAASLRPAEASS